MSIRMIEEDELRKRITEHLAARPGLTDVMQFWDGYIMALAEARVIDGDLMERLLDMLPRHDGVVVVEAMCGEEYFMEHPIREAMNEAA